MIDLFTTQVSFLVFEAFFCLLAALVYAISNDPLQSRKSTVLSLNISCGLMLICEYLFYVYKGSTDPVDVVIMRIVNAAVYYLIVLLMLFYAMLVSIRLFEKFSLKADMPCRKRLITVCCLVILGLLLVTISQFTGIYYYFDANNVYQRGPLFLVSAIIPMIGAMLIGSIILQFRNRLPLKQRLVLLSYLILPLIGEVVQVLFYGNSLMNICMGLSVLLMFFENMIYKEKEILQASRTEVRTGLANETGYIEWLNGMKGKSELQNYAAVFFDLHRFSSINRIYGIENGNRVLASFGNIMRSHIDKDEIIGRQFGNQFIAIVKKEHLQDFLDLLHGVEVPFTDITTGQENKVILSSHIGVYNIDNSELNGEDALVFAGHAISAAKAKNTDEIVWMTQELLDSIAERKELESEIKAGLNNKEFLPFYQPKVNIQTGKLCGAEALSRWHRDGKVISPGRYIPVMESNDTICLMDFAILQAVCEDIVKWRSEGIEVPTISVNFSRRNLIDPELAEHIDSVVVSSGVPKDLIEVEVTESSDEFSVDVLMQFVRRLHELGYKVSIDDFGSASSSLRLLREISFDTLKIDKSFVDNLNTKDITVITYIVKLAEEIGMHIVAEGVEQESQIAILHKLGVDIVQGFYFDRPLPKEDITGRFLSPQYEKARGLPSEAEDMPVSAPAAMSGEFMEFLSRFNRVACVMSVHLNRQGEDRYHVVDANDAYKKTVVEKMEDFEKDVPYTRYIPRAANFEALCDSCVVTDRPIHTYFDIELYNAWMEVFLTPLASSDPDRKMLLFSYEMNPKADVEKMADISPETATNVLRTCLTLRETTDFQQAIDTVVEDIRRQCGAKSCRILLTDFEKQQCSLLSEAYEENSNILPMSAYLNDDFFHIVETWPKLINKSNCFIIANEKDMEYAAGISPSWVESLRIANVERLVIYPLRSDNKTIGYIWQSNFDETKTLLIKETLNIIAFILSAEISNELNIRKMKVMSSTDLLTGVYNRNAMNNRITEDVNGENVIEPPFGIFFVDVNGLKTTNDTKGHLAGDKLLVDVASTLKELEGENIEVYRVGGDEFMILAHHMPSDEFGKLKETLLQNAERPERAHFAVGACHSDEVPDIRKAMQKADARMYEIKKEYYTRHPEYEWYQKPVG